MAQIGLRYPVYAPLVEDEAAGTYTYGTGKVAAKAISVEMSLNIADAPLYADDGIAERVREFIDGTLNFTPDDLSDEVKAEWLGSEIEEETIDEETTVSVLKSATQDMPGYFGFGFIVPKVKNNVRKYRAILFAKVQFAEPNESAQSKGESISWQTPGIEGKIMRRVDEVWKEETTVDSLATAKAWLAQKLNLPPAVALKSLIVGALELTPAFSQDILEYTAETDNDSDIIVAMPLDPEATVTIDLNDGTPVTNGQAATWAAGENTLEITVTKGTTSRVYTVTVTKTE